MTPNAARQIVNRSIERGWLTRRPCEVCGEPQTHAHHRWGYERALDVAWLCPVHHLLEHGQGIGDNYRRVLELAETGMTQADIAREVGLSRQRVHQMLRRGPDGRRYRAAASNTWMAAHKRPTAA